MKTSYSQQLVDLIVSRGPIVGFQSRALYTEVRAAGFSVTYNQFRNLGETIKIDSGFAASPGSPRNTERVVKPLSTIADVSAQEQERMRAEAERRLFRELRGQKALTDAITDAMERVYRTVPQVEIPVLKAPTPSDSHGQTAIQLLSDLHVGNRVDLEETGGLGEYSYPIFKQRLARLQDAMRSITAHHRRSHAVPRLVMPWLGDMIEGTDIFPSQGELIDLNLLEQIENTIVDLTEFTLGLLDTFETIFIPVVTGNHGRVGKKGQHKRWINWDYHVGRMVMLNLKQYDRITFEVPRSSFAITEIEGYRWLLRHGDGIKSWGGIPFYGISRSTGRWIAIQASVGERFDYMAMGHFHTPTNLSYTGGEVIINGCFPGPTEYSVEVIETLNRPMQFFGMMHPKYGLAARYPILLDPTPRIPG